MLHRVFLLPRQLKILFILIEWQNSVKLNLKLSKAVHLRGANDLSFFKPTQGGPSSHVSEKIFKCT